ncbi:hypothetical protein F4819DRAFT_302592 [Hypoxylon fuscum]|nr:hypothetical protein F4819DRAFT_302592 [Hypoxylon fuscum]
MDDLVDFLDTSDIKSRQARIACPKRHAPNPTKPFPQAPTLNTPEKNGLVNALYSLQTRRTDNVQRWAMFDNVEMLEDSLNAAGHRALHYYVGGAEGLFYPRKRTAQAIQHFFRARTGNGDFLRYAVPFPEMRGTARFSFWVMPVGPLYVLIAFQIRVLPANTVTNNGDQVQVERVCVYDVVQHGREERLRLIRRRLQAVLPEGDLLPPPPTGPDGNAGIFEVMPTPRINNELWRSGFIIFGILQTLTSRASAAIERGRMDHPRNHGVLERVDMEVTPGYIELMRSYMIGALCGRFHKLHRYYSLTAIELPGADSEYRPEDMQVPAGIQASKIRRGATYGHLLDMAEKGSGTAENTLKRLKRKYEEAHF